MENNKYQQFCLKFSIADHNRCFLACSYVSGRRRPDNKLNTFFWASVIWCMLSIVKFNLPPWDAHILLAHWKSKNYIRGKWNHLKIYLWKSLMYVEWLVWVRFLAQQVTFLIFFHPKLCYFSLKPYRSLDKFHSPNRLKVFPYAKQTMSNPSQESKKKYAI